MSVLLRASELEGRPIVTFAGESPAEVKDVVFDSLNGTLLGMTLRGHGLFSRPRKDILPWPRIHSIGRDAVMIRDEDAFQGEGALPAEPVVITYDAMHRPVAVSGNSTYLTNVLYSNTGKPEQYELGITGGSKTWLTNTYEWGTQRLSTSRDHKWSF